MRSGDSIVGAGANRQRAPRPVPGSSPPTAPEGRPSLGPFRLGPGYSPWKDPTVLLLLAISLAAAVMFVGGAAIGPALSGGGGGGVFPVVDILTGDGDGDSGPTLSLDANRTALTIGEPVAFTVTDGNDTPARNATVAIAGATHRVDGSGRVVVRPDRAGDLTATASEPGPNESTLASNDVSLSVAPRSVQLAVQANRSVAIAGEPIALTLVRADTGAALRGTIGTRFVGADEFFFAGEARVHDGARFVLVPERAGRLHVVGSRADGGGETYQRHVGSIAVERRTVALDVSVDPGTIVAGESVTATVRRGDTGEPVAATLAVGNRTIETGADGRARVSLATAGPATIRATAPRTPAITFAPDEARVTVERRTVPLALSVDPTAITDGGRVTATVRRGDTGEPIAGAVTVGNRTIDTGPDGTASVAIDAPGAVDAVADAPDSPTETFATATETVSVSNATVDLELVDAPASVGPGARVTIAVRATNRGPAAATDTFRFAAGGEPVADRSRSVAAGNRTTLAFETRAPDSPGQLAVTVRGSDDTVETTIDVED